MRRMTNNDVRKNSEEAFVLVGYLHEEREPHLLVIHYMWQEREASIHLLIRFVIRPSNPIVTSTI